MSESSSRRNGSDEWHASYSPEGFVAIEEARSEPVGMEIALAPGEERAFLSRDEMAGFMALAGFEHADRVTVLNPVRRFDPRPFPREKPLQAPPFAKEEPIKMRIAGLERADREAMLESARLVLDVILKNVWKYRARQERERELLKKRVDELRKMVCQLQREVLRCRFAALHSAGRAKELALAVDKALVAPLTRVDMLISLEMLRKAREATR